MRRLGAVIMLGMGLPGAAQAGWFSDELPPANAKPLSVIVKAVEDEGIKTITDIEFEDGVWSIEAHQVDGKEITLKVNPVTGEIRH
jgi:hypothetical protein